MNSKRIFENFELIRDYSLEVNRNGLPSKTTESRLEVTIGGRRCCAEEILLGFFYKVRSVPHLFPSETKTPLYWEVLTSQGLKKKIQYCNLLSVPNYSAHLLNCPIGGDEFTMQDGRNVRSLTRFTVEGLDIELIQRPEFSMANYFDHRGSVIETTDLIIRDLPANRLEEAERIALDTSWLLSFATSSQVVHSGYDYGERIGRRGSFIGVLKYFRPAFKPTRGDLLKLLLQQCFQNYRRLETVRRLNIAFDYYGLSQNQDAIELGLITTFVLMENLKYTFAEQQGYPFLKKYFRALGATEKKVGPPKTFEILLTEMFGSVGMAPSLQRAIDLRNEVIHSGLSALTTANQWTIYEECQDIIREYLLRLLGYQGEYFSFSDAPELKRIQ